LAFEMFKQFFGGEDYFGSRLDVPKVPDLSSILKGGVAANVASVPDLQALATSTNIFNQAEITRMLESTTPGLLAGMRSATGIAASLARGEIPEDVSRAVLSATAARALGGGFAGSGLGRNLTARDLGLTSLNLSGEGQQRLMGLGAFSRQLFPTFDYTTAFFSPAQMLDYTYSKFQRDLLAAKSAAAPDPVARGQADQEMALFGMIMSAYSGGAGYGGYKSSQPDLPPPPPPPGGGGGGGSGSSYLPAPANYIGTATAMGWG